MIPDAIVEEVRARADIVELIGEQVSLKRSGKDFKGLCPFHNDRNPSFYVVPAKGIYKCFSCGESGDVFTFAMKRNGLGFLEAVRQIAARVGVHVPDAAADRREDEPNRVLYEAIAFAADHFHHALWDGDDGERARRYLDGRGIPREAAERFQVGYAPEGWQRLREAAHRHGIEDAVLLAAGLIKEPDRGDEPYDRFRDRIIFPIAEVSGRIVAFGGRVLSRSDGAPKYLNSPETPIYHKGAILYGLNWSKSSIRREGSALVVEGYMDYVSLAARGIEHAVAGLGTALTTEQANLISRYTARAYLLYDSDIAGLRATFRTADALLQAGVHPLVVTLPEGEDPDSVVRKGGSPALAACVDAAQDVLELKLAMLDARGSFADIEGSRRALDRLLPTLRAAIDPALRDIYVGRVAERTGVRRETLEAEMAAPSPSFGTGAANRAARARRNRGAGRPGVGARAPVGWAGGAERPKRDDPEAERLLLLLLVRDPELIGTAVAELRTQDFRSAVNAEIFTALVAERESAGALPSERELSRPAAERLAQLHADRTEVSDADRSFADAVADMKVRGLFLQLEALTGRIIVAPAEEQLDLMRQRLSVKELLQALGADPERGLKASPRLNAYASGKRPGTEPPTPDE